MPEICGTASGAGAPRPIPQQLFFQGSAAAVAANALVRAEQAGREYAFASKPTSPNPRLSGNAAPGLTRLGWLGRQYKCNQYVGDVLTLSGYRMPEVRMPDGTVHYAIAERLPLYRAHFDRIAQLPRIQPGDLVVIDYLSAAGPATAHVEVIVNVNAAAGSLESVGAHYDGAYLKRHPGFFSRLACNAAEQCWQGSGVKVYVLRPKLRG